MNRQYILTDYVADYLGPTKASNGDMHPLFVNLNMNSGVLTMSSPVWAATTLKEIFEHVFDTNVWMLKLYAIDATNRTPCVFSFINPTYSDNKITVDTNKSYYRIVDGADFIPLEHYMASIYFEGMENADD